MVRRWSYINSVNNLTPTNFRYMRKAAFDVTVNSTMYLRKTYSIPTRLTRKRWARRKHIHNWLYSANVLKDWAKSYRFYKNHNKSVLNQFFTPSSFIAFNLVSLTNSLPCLHKGSENVVTASFTRRILKYFSNYSSLNPRLRALAQLKYLNFSFMSIILTPDTAHLLEPSKFLFPVLTDHSNTLSTLSTATHSEPAAPATEITKLLNLVFRAWNLQAVSIYRSLVQLSLTRF